MSAGQTGHFHGTNGTRPQDVCSPSMEACPHLSFMFAGFFLFPSLPSPPASVKPCLIDEGVFNTWKGEKKQHTTNVGI